MKHNAADGKDRIRSYPLIEVLLVGCVEFVKNIILIKILIFVQQSSFLQMLSNIVKYCGVIIICVLGVIIIIN